MRAYLVQETDGDNPCLALVGAFGIERLKLI